MKLNAGQINFLRLTLRDGDAEGWARVSKILWPLAQWWARRHPATWWWNSDWFKSATVLARHEFRSKYNRII